MPRTTRKHSESDIYHITTRGAGRRTLFEDDEDKTRFVDRLHASSIEQNVSVLAWCLMDNHYHLLLKGSLDSISAMMQQLNTSLAHWYNGRYGHIGPVTQGRFSSSPVEDDTYLLEVVRYIHLNPKDMHGVDFRSYPWSSYRQYMGLEGICDTKMILDMLGGKKELESFHNFPSASDAAMEMLEHKPMRPYLSDREAREKARKTYGADFSDAIATMDKMQRNAALKKLHVMGISIRQLERLTGIGRGIIQPAVKGR